MNLIFDAKAHTYTLDGVVLPSVTQVLRASGLIDFSGIPAAVLASAQSRGTKVHSAVHYYNENDLDVGEFVGTFPDYAGFLQSWIALAETGRLKPYRCEYRVVSRKHRYAGTIDWIGEFDGKGAILDFATGDPEDVAKHLQTAGYECAAREQALEDLNLAAFFKIHPSIGRYSVRLKKDGGLPTPHPYRDPRDLSKFLALVTARHIVEQEKGPAQAWMDAWLRDAA